MKKAMILLVLMMVVILSGMVDVRDNFDGSTTTLEEQPNRESNSNIDEIIKYYKLFQQIETLEAHIDSLNVRCLCLEKKVEVLEKAVEYETFKRPDKKPDPSETIIYDQDNEAILDEISDIWEAVDKINRRLK